MAQPPDETLSVTKESSSLSALAASRENFGTDHWGVVQTASDAFSIVAVTFTLAVLLLKVQTTGLWSSSPCTELDAVSEPGLRVHDWPVDSRVAALLASDEPMLATVL